VTVVYSLKNAVKERLIDGVGFRLLVPEIQISAQENIALMRQEHFARYAGANPAP
jgi:hypothetical protein